MTEIRYSNHASLRRRALLRINDYLTSLYITKTSNNNLKSFHLMHLDALVLNKVQFRSVMLLHIKKADSYR